MSSPHSPGSGPAVTFWGAARTITGSMHMVDVGGEQILLDCGLFLDRGPEARERNRTFPFDPCRVRAVVLSHAHIDHCGNLANLVRQGFAGPILCTPATRDLLALMLADSAKIHEENALHANAVRSPDAPYVEPLSTRDDVRRTMEACVPVAYDTPVALNSCARLRLLEAGHVLGSAMIELTLAWGGRQWKVVFTGDVGRSGMPLLRDAASLPPADLVICESTYGGQSHDPIEQTTEMLRVMARQTLARGGKVLIPTFSLGRSQMLVHCLLEMIRAGQLPAVPLFVDSPLASDIAAVYRRHLDHLAPAVAAQLAAGGDFLDGPEVHYVRALEESRQLGGRKGPCVLVASGGMCEGGRILHHLKHNVDDPRASIILVSYQAPDTLGWRLLERKPTVRFLGRQWNKWAEVIALKGFSGHADQKDLLTLLAPQAGRVRQVRLVHGEPAPAETLATELRHLGFADVAVPKPGETVFLS